MSALANRLPLTHIKKQEILEDLRNFTSGFKGEQSLEFFYRYLPKDQFQLLHGIRIEYDDFHFQMDSLIVTPSFILNLEIKNWGGNIYFDDRFSQVIRTLDGKQQSFTNPIEQVKRQNYHLSQLLLQHKFRSIPVEHLVIMTNPNVIIEASSTYKEAYKSVIKSHVLQKKFQEFTHLYETPIFSSKQTKKFIKLLSKLHCEYNPDVCEKYQITKDELITGVLCPSCDHSVMNYVKGNWWCSICSFKSKTTHIYALKDYALLISSMITNQECRNFLLLDSRSKTNHLLYALNLPSTGSTKSRQYDLAPLIKEK
ncbi:nuclease-related domain-containing protein [Fictibacillus barbaricus]|uniref:NERD domain-containing protein n=1 Tax=Fictibacillus barbaricus TaxID=182136 RepID=A0ABU1U5D4_9BACL|nr:nuclease-related domain-containing protein [Fictibacillus barbaricus]MDR7074652.1 hypothetical protein [Fictibacillus barbaricus]